MKTLLKHLFLLTVPVWCSIPAVAQDSILSDPFPSKPENPSQSVVFDNFDCFFMEVPEFPGGTMARMKYLEENISYPKICQEARIQGTVYVKFTVSESGKIADAEILRGLCPEIDEMVISVILSMPDWEWPATAQFRFRTSFLQPVRFTLEDSKITEEPVTDTVKPPAPEFPGQNDSTLSTGPVTENSGPPSSLQSTKISLYPNPAVDFISLNTEDLSGPFFCNIFDFTGRMVKSLCMAEGGRADISDLPKGVYQINISSSGMPGRSLRLIVSE